MLRMTKAQYMTLEDFCKIKYDWYNGIGDYEGVKAITDELKAVFSSRSDWHEFGAAAETLAAWAPRHNFDNMHEILEYMKKRMDAIRESKRKANPNNAPVQHSVFPLHTSKRGGQQ